MDYWVTFNEPHLWVFLTHCLGVWPPGPPLHPLQSALCMLPGSTFSQAMRLVARAHIQAAHAIRKQLSDAESNRYFLHQYKIGHPSNTALQPSMPTLPLNLSDGRAI